VLGRISANNHNDEGKPVNRQPALVRAIFDKLKRGCAKGLNGKTLSGAFNRCKALNSSDLRSLVRIFGYVERSPRLQIFSDTYRFRISDRSALPTLFQRQVQACGHRHLQIHALETSANCWRRSQPSVRFCTAPKKSRHRAHVLCLPANNF
jgi:hypothetical protein